MRFWAFQRRQAQNQRTELIRLRSREPDRRPAYPVTKLGDRYQNAAPARDKREGRLYVSVKVAFRYADRLCRFRDRQRDAWNWFDGSDVKGLC